MKMGNGRPNPDEAFTGKIALYGVESETYRQLVADESVVKKKAMCSQKA
jgi:hypothetical protein